jgi:putative tricarboxylic transport membrane protein
MTPVRERLVQKSVVNQDSLAGLMFAAVGVLGLWFGRNYGMGTSARMGPGYLPTILCVGMILLGAIISFRGVTFGSGQVAALRLRPIVAVLVGLVAFMLLLQTMGLPIAVFTCVAIGSLGSDSRPIEIVLLAMFLAVAVSALFILGLGLPLKFWP